VKRPRMHPSAYGSTVMARVRAKDTKPELLVRRLTHGLGLRFRLHRADLPGKPDLVFPRHNRILFVHGCFWHGHDCRNGLRRPKTNKAFWVDKINSNRLRDERVVRRLRRMGWHVMIVWECKMSDQEALRQRIIHFFGL
jgi:DNA mismatch endonuclease, patch repair protein